MMRVDDALVAADAGADAIGLLFHSASPRNLPLDRAKQIVAALPAFVTPVAIFVDASAEAIHSTCQHLGVHHVQLNGHEPPSFISDLSDFTITKAVRVDPETFQRTLSEWRTGIQSLKLTNLKGLVLETAGTKQPGGTGVPNNWAAVIAAQSAGAFRDLPPTIAAGGLRPETVADVVRTIRPYAVDVSSGVEEKLGEKSPEKIHAFIRAVHSADS
jgi:phosphoribosylanthranilate isomerase